MDHKPVICVIGCGYVGLTTAAVLANCGFSVRAIEINPERLKSIQAGKSFFYEIGIDALLESAFNNKSLIATNSYETAVPGSDIVFSCVGTPDNPDGSSNLSYVFAAATKTAELLRPDAIFVQKSTVPVGTGEKIEQLFSEANKSIHYVSNPEFLREGTAISDTLWCERIVVGSNDQEAANKIIEVYKSLAANREAIIQIAELGAPKLSGETSYITTGLNSAELIKVTANAFLALKISFANSIAKLADQAGADIIEVMDAVGADRRIGRAFLNAGRGYGGGCFPKDVSGLMRSAEDHGVNLEIMNAATEVNESMPHYIINRAGQAYGESFNGQNVAVLGLAFKAGTSDTRRSPAIDIANTLADQGANVRAYDPEAMHEAKPLLDSGIQLCESLDGAIQNAACIFIATDWPEFVRFDWQSVSSAKLIVDCMNCLYIQAINNGTTKYLGVGRWQK